MEAQRPGTPPDEPNHPPSRARGNSPQDIAAYRYLRKHAIGNEAERIERRLYLESQHPNLGRRMEVGETRRMNAYRIVGEPAARERERQRPGTPPDEPREPDPQTARTCATASLDCMAKTEYSWFSGLSLLRLSTRKLGILDRLHPLRFCQRGASDRSAGAVTKAPKAPPHSASAHDSCALVG